MFTYIYDILTFEMNKCLQEIDIPEWMAKGKTTLILKDYQKGTDPNNYRTTSWL